MLNRLLFVLGLLVLTAGWAIASEGVFQDVILEPGARTHYGSSLDDPQPDTIYYDDGTPNRLWTGYLHWTRVRFTAPNDFELRSIYFFTTNAADTVCACSVFVHAVNPNGTMGALLGSTVVDPNTIVDWDWNDCNLAQPVQLQANDNFFVVLGPSPGGAQTHGWHIVFDAATTVNRSAVYTASRTNPGHYGTYTNITGDWIIRAGGEAAGYIDIAAEECYNNTTSGPAFNVVSGTPMTLGAQVHVVGNHSVEVYTVAWTVWAPGGTVDFTDEVVGGPLARGDVAQHTSSQSYTPTVEGEYRAMAVVQADSDAVTQNDTTFLRFFVGGLHRWFRYDDNLAPNSYTGGSEGMGWGVAFRPSAYTASVESVRVAVQAGGVSDVRVYVNGADGLPSGDPAWSDTPVLAQGWNALAVSPPALIYQGQSFTVAFVWTTLALGVDGNPPNCAGITHMNMPSLFLQNETWSTSTSGNWCIQAYLDTSSAQPPFAIIETVPSDTLHFGQIDTTGQNNLLIPIHVYNRGANDALRITQVTITPATIRSAFTINPTTLTVQHGDSGIINVTFNPSQVRSYNGSLTIYNNSANNDTLILIVRAQGVSGGGAVDIAGGELPAAFELCQNYPNPFNPVTSVEFAVPMASRVKIAVFNLLGQEMAVLEDGFFGAGTYRTSFDASAMPAGLYFCRMQAGDFTSIRKMMLVK